MSRYPQDFDPNAADYAGDDRAASETFARMARLIRSLQNPPLVRIIGRRAYPGFYNGYEIDGAMPVDGSIAPPDPYYGAQLNQRTVCVINTADFGSGDWCIPIPRTLPGVRRQGLNGETQIVVGYFGNAGDPNGNLPPPGDTGPGSGAGGGVGGSGGLGANPSMLCSLNYAVTNTGVSGTAHDTFFNSTFTLVWDGVGQWKYQAPLPWSMGDTIDIALGIFGTDSITGLPTAYIVNQSTSDGLWGINASKGPPAGNSGCPSLGAYTNINDTNGGTATVS